MLLTSDDGNSNSHLKDSNDLKDAMAKTNPAMTFIMGQVNFSIVPIALRPMRRNCFWTLSKPVSASTAIAVMAVPTRLPTTTCWT